MLRVVLQLVLIVGISALSWSFVEDPIRRYGLVGALRHRRGDDDGRRLVPAVNAPPAAVCRPCSAGRWRWRSIATATLSAAAILRPEGTGARPSPSGGATTGVDLEKPPVPSAEPSGAESEEEPEASSLPPVTTSCQKVVHVGDSTSIGLMDKNYLPKKKDRVDAQYRKVGVADASTDIKGARSIVERYKGQPNAEDAVRGKLDRGYDGCWVLAMGTNEVANQFAGSNTGSNKRIDLLMEPIGNHPVLWLTIKTQRSSGPYRNVESEKWTQALSDACARYPNMRVYDWASEVKDSWYVDDGIHFTSKGYRERAKRAARALALAFPKDGVSPPGCLIRTS